MNAVWDDTKLSRSAAVAAMLVLLATLFYFTAITPPLGPPEPTSRDIVTWTHAHEPLLLFQFVPAFTALIYAVLIGLLVQLTRRSGLLPNLAWLAMGANFAVALITFGLYFGLWSYTQRGGSDDGVVVLRSVASLFTHGQLIPLGVAIGGVGLLGLSSRVWPVWLSCLCLLVGLEHLVSPIVFAAAPSFSTTGHQMTLGGFARVADIVLEYVWLVAVTLVLAIKPVRVDS
ncbi:MAG TPA: hypothetical protein VF956_04530 [Candidatus Dormibacteraeota bacterium]